MRAIENALTHQACILRADLEKAVQDNASLFSKIGECSYSFHRSDYKNLIMDMLLHLLGREEKLNIDNKATLNNFQVELTQQVGSLCNTVATSLSRQNEHLECVENLCHSFLDIHDKVRVK